MTAPAWEPPLGGHALLDGVRVRVLRHADGCGSLQVVLEGGGPAGRAGEAARVDPTRLEPCPDAPAPKVKVVFFRESGKFLLDEDVPWTAPRHGDVRRGGALLHAAFAASLATHLRSTTDAERLARGEVRLAGSLAVCVDPYPGHADGYPVAMPVDHALKVAAGETERWYALAPFDGDELRVLGNALSHAVAHGAVAATPQEDRARLLSLAERLRPGD